MEHQVLSPFVGSYDIQFGGFDKLMPFRVREVLLVASPYDSFLLADDDALTELVFSEYLDLNLRYAPRVTRVPTAEEALRRIAGEPFDLIITMAQIGNLDVAAFAREAKRLRPELPVILLCLNVTDFAELSQEDRDAVDRIFAWQGDPRIFMALIKLVEDQRNIDHDVALSSVQAILLIEDSVRIYSAYLPIIYAEVMKQTQRLLAEGINLTHKMLRMRARPKILLAHDFESGWALYRKYHTHLLGVITDVEFPRRAQEEGDPQAGLIFASNVKAEVPDMPVLIQSSDAGQAAAAAAVGASFLEKSSPTLLKQLGDFMLDYLGFGDFVFRDAQGREHGRAADVHGLVEKLRVVPDASIEFHASRNHFSKWLMARTEFEVAYQVRRQQVADFRDIGELRQYLIAALHQSLYKTQQGAITQFDGRFFDAESPFVKIGRGSIGGKARGLAFVNFLLSRDGVADRFPGVRITVPHTSVVSTDAFDRFIEDNRMAAFVREERGNAELAAAFVQGRLPDYVMAGLQTLAAKLQGPLAVRSSSLFEDSRSQPFAGVYKTYMLPNNDPDPQVRLAQLVRAVKLVYASAYCVEARAYLKLTTHLPDEEKMAVIVQRIVGRAHADGSRFYPSFSGVLQSCNYYPVPPITADDPVANVALGLGAAIVEGYKCLRFSPNHPRRLHQFSSVRDTLDSSQRDFLALDASNSATDLGYDYEPNMVWCDLEAAAADGTLAPLASTYSADNQAISDGMSRPGIRLVTFAPILKHDAFPLCEILNFVAGLGREAMGSQVEIEFAVNLEPGADGKREFAILQMRPMMSQWGGQQVRLDDLAPERVICESPSALGNGYIDDVRDIVYVRPEGFDPAQTLQIAAQIEAVNHELKQEGRRYALIGPGRWGSADPWLGIPARWHQISGSRVIVETSLPNYVIDPSFGTHFFHNVTSLGLGYFIIHPQKSAGRIRWDWLDAQPARRETPLLRHVQLDRPLDIRIDGRTGRGVFATPAPEAPETQQAPGPGA